MGFCGPAWRHLYSVIVTHGSHVLVLLQRLQGHGRSLSHSWDPTWCLRPCPCQDMNSFPHVKTEYGAWLLTQPRGLSWARVETLVLSHYLTWKLSPGPHFLFQMLRNRRARQYRVKLRDKHTATVRIKRVAHP